MVTSSSPQITANRETAFREFVEPIITDQMRIQNMNGLERVWNEVHQGLKQDWFYFFVFWVGSVFLGDFLEVFQ